MQSTPCTRHWKRGCALCGLIAALSAPARAADDKAGDVKLKPQVTGQADTGTLKLQPIIKGQEPAPTPPPKPKPAATPKPAKAEKSAQPGKTPIITPTPVATKSARAEDSTTEGSLKVSPGGKGREAVDRRLEMMETASPRMGADGANQTSLLASVDAALKTPATPVEAAKADTSDSLDALMASAPVGELHKALQQWAAAHPGHPRAAEAWYDLGKLRMNMGHAEPAARAFESAREAGPGKPYWQQATLGLALARAAQAAYPESALRWGELAKDPTAPAWALAGLAWALDASGKAPEANALWTRIEQTPPATDAPAPLTAPSGATAMLARALGTEMAGDSKAARAIYEAIRRDYPGSPEEPLAGARLADLNRGLIASAK